MTIKELLVLFKFNVDGPSFQRAQGMLSALEGQAERLENVKDKARRATTDNAKGIADGARSASLGMDALIGRFKMLAGLAGISLTIGGLIQTADQWRTIEGQVKNVLGEGESLVDIQEKLYQISGRTRQSYAQTAGLFTSVSRSASELGKSTEEILAFTEDVAMALRAGGGNADSQAAALVQLGQALGSGALRGDELNSILEQAPVLANTIAQGMGASIGQLRRLGREGKITSQIIFESVRKMHDDLVRQNKNAPLTIAAATLRVRDAVSRVIFRIEKSIGVVSRLSNAIAKVGDYVDMIDVDAFVVGLKLAAFWAGLIYLYLRRAFIIEGLGILLNNLGLIVGFLLNIYNGLKMLMGMSFASQTARYMGIVGSTLIKASAAVMGVVAVITALLLVVEDLYTWSQGGDSIIGKMLGGLSFAERWSQWLTEFKASMNLIGQLGSWIGEKLGNIGSAGLESILWLLEGIGVWLKLCCQGVLDFIGWINDLLNALDKAQSWLTGKKLGFWEKRSDKLIDPSRILADGGSSSTDRSVNNSGNVTNHIQITAPNGTAEAIAGALDKTLTAYPTIGFDLSANEG